MADRKDTAESLKTGIEILAATQKPAADLGASRHSTTIISARTLRVFERKYEVLKPLADAVAAFKEMCTRKEQIVKDVIAGMEPSEAAGDALGMSDKIENAIHKPDGRPERADRFKFNVFVRTFKLASDHQTILHADEILKAECDPWAELASVAARQLVDAERAVAQEAPKPHWDSPAANASMRLATLLIGVGLDPGSKKVRNTEQLALAAKASQMRLYAEYEYRMVKANPNIEGCKKAADRMEAAVNAAKEFGCGDDNPEMKIATTCFHDCKSESIRRMAEDKVARMGKALGDAGRVANEIDDAMA